MTQTTTLNRSDIMTAAWETYRRFNSTLPFCARAFGYELRIAWHKAKMAIARLCPIQRTRCAIAALESKAKLTQPDYARLGVLRAALYAKIEAAQAHEEAAPAYAEKRQLIEAAGGRFCAVTFTKKDGTERTMQVQPATLKNHVKSDAATDAGKRAIATRKATHPNLLPVWDAIAKAPRSINLATVSRIAVNGQIHDYAACPANPPNKLTHERITP